MLTLQDIENISFRESRFGNRSYICEDVDRFVDDVTETVRDLENKNKELQARMEQLENQLHSHEEKADSVQDAIITAEITAKSLIKNATTKAEKIMSEATEKSEKLIAESQKKADSNIYDSAEKARMILDNALSDSAACVSENNRIIEDQKVYITLLQDESTKFRESLLDMYKKHLEWINNLPREQECKKYQQELKENYPTEEPVTADAVVERLKNDAEKAVIPKRDEREITVEIPDNKKTVSDTDKKNDNEKPVSETESVDKKESSKEEVSEEVVFNSSGASPKFSDIKNENVTINFVNTNDTSEKK